jgi:hypothetical protein
MAERRPPNQDRQKPMRIPREALWVLAGLGGLILVLFALVIGPWWFTRHPHHGLTAEQELKAKNDVRTTLVQALGGLAVAGGLAVTYRTYRQNRTEQDRTYKLRQAEQVNERYTKAVEQLGHEKAPVRLGALHSLERLAQDNLELRPLVVDVLCAYLRMPYTPPMPDEPTTEPVAATVEAADTKVETASTKSDRENRERDAAQELQVRKTAQRLLADHLRPAGRDARRIEPSPEEFFWPNTSLDLTGAALVDFDFKSVSVVQARFDGATFQGDAAFGGATFTSGNGGMGVAGATVLHLDDPDLNGSDHRVWPDGYTVRPDPADPTRGSLVHEGQAEEPEPTALPSDRPADHGLGTG